MGYQPGWRSMIKNEENWTERRTGEALSEIYEESEESFEEKLCAIILRMRLQGEA